MFLLTLNSLMEKYSSHCCLFLSLETKLPGESFLRVFFRPSSEPQLPSHEIQHVAGPHSGGLCSVLQQECWFHLNALAVKCYVFSKTTLAF